MADISPDWAASATGLRRLCAAVAVNRHVRRRAVKPATRRLLIDTVSSTELTNAFAGGWRRQGIPGSEQFREWPRAVSLLVLIDAEQVQHADEQVARWDR